MSVVKGPDSGMEVKLKQMIDEHQTFLLRLCYLYLHDVQLAEDAVQETFIKAAQGLHSFRGDSLFHRTTYLLQYAAQFLVPSYGQTCDTGNAAGCITGT